MSAPSSTCPKSLGQQFYTLFLQQCQRRGAMQAVADEMRMDKTKASRIKTEDMPELFEMIARHDLKVVRADEHTYPQEVIDALFALAKNRLNNVTSAQQLTTGE